jgi:hypothetical protein
LALVACVLLGVAEFMELNHIDIITVRKDGVGVGGHHGYALLVIALAGALMAWGAWRGSRPAAIALAVLGAAAVVIVLVVDLPDVDATGLYGRDYEQATSKASAGFRVEAIGAVLLLFAGVVTAVLGPSSAPAPRERRPQPVGDEGAGSAAP